MSLPETESGGITAPPAKRLRGAQQPLSLALNAFIDFSCIVFPSVISYFSDCAALLASLRFRAFSDVQGSIASSQHMVLEIWLRRKKRNLQCCTSGRSTRNGVALTHRWQCQASVLWVAHGGPPIIRPHFVCQGDAESGGQPHRQGRSGTDCAISSFTQLCHI